MATLWNWILSILVWLSAGDSDVHEQQPKAAAAVMTARASMDAGPANVLP